MQTSPSVPLVLVVDDNQISQLIVAEMLTRLGINFSIATDGADAIEKCHSRRPRLVLMDIWMSGMTGLDVAKVIRSNWDNPWPVMVALSADTSPEVRDRCSKAGFEGFLAKPVEIAAMQEILEQHLGMPLNETG